MSIKLFSFLLLIILIGSCNPLGREEKSLNGLTVNSNQPPIKNADIPYSEYLVSAEKGDTIFYETGSIILFPPSSFIDKEGHLVKGNVKVKYREFASPIDFYLSGIPMSYDSLGKRFEFESAGMCEILAFKDSEPVFVNPQSKPEIHIGSRNPSKEQNLYFFDTTLQKWIPKGASIITDLSNSGNDQQASGAFSGELVEPVKPERANGKNPLIKVAIEPGSFKELLAYDNLQFEVDSREKNFNPMDSTVEWTDVEVTKGPGRGLYSIKFSNAVKTVSYPVRPVFEGKDYERALKVFDKKNKEYQQQKSERLANEKIKKEKYLQDSITDIAQQEENDRIERLNALIAIRNKEIERKSILTEKLNRKIGENNQLTRLLRSFRIDGFGIWNCDQLLIIDHLPVVASFTDKTGNPIQLTNIAVLYKSLNGIIRYNDNNLGVLRDTENMIIGVYNGRFAYISYSDFGKLMINAETKAQTFIMTIVEEKDNNYQFIKSITGR